jgi:small multidrug resistance pump
MIGVYLMLATAIVSNIATVYFMKMSAGLTQAWPTLAMLIATLLTNWFLGRAFASGANVGPAVMILTVGVMVGSFAIGLAFGERVTLYQAVGVITTIVGVIIVNMNPPQPS